MSLIKASEGKVFRRIADGTVYGNELYLGYTYIIGGVILDEPHLDTPEDFEEIDAVAEIIPGGGSSGIKTIELTTQEPEPEVFICPGWTNGFSIELCCKSGCLPHNAVVVGVDIKYEGSWYSEANVGLVDILPHDGSIIVHNLPRLFDSCDNYICFATVMDSDNSSFLYQMGGYINPELTDVRLYYMEV